MECLMNSSQITDHSTIVLSLLHLLGITTSYMWPAARDIPRATGRQRGLFKHWSLLSISARIHTKLFCNIVRRHYIMVTAQLSYLFGRQIRTNLPVMEEQLYPKWPDFQNLRQGEDAYRANYKENYDRRHRAAELPPLQPGTPSLGQGHETSWCGSAAPWHSSILPDQQPGWSAATQPCPSDCRTTWQSYSRSTWALRWPPPATYPEVIASVSLTSVSSPDTNNTFQQR